ncbi:aminoglycoside adenylyltransferase domain-containing protein [Tumebacillus flagellatus]|uniref:Adenylyltransferase AadA C-terminal domain-containing protein n=1 Tax=Tumebacillus flagellatus TaxID=1157490 RepID=A0A074LXJ9_9BACL|nr:aminoglycoside adenylyltransferase domain-containing protein [Tumebacillus flagellatus]KEO84843.1 hypothetical protein EL26_02205 [Tumebacillus flagellatus]
MNEKTALPPTLVPLLDGYQKLLHSALGDLIHGVYLYGSTALGAYEPTRSDIDFLTLLNRPLQGSELERLRGVHLWLEREFEDAGKLEGMYIPLTDAGLTVPQLPEHPWYANGRFMPKGHYDINHVTWWTVKNRAISLVGPAPADLPFDVPWERVVETMQYNLEHYWAGKAARRFLFFLDEWIEFSVLTLCRIHYTLAERDLLSKTAVVDYALQTFPPRWHRLIREALRVREGREKKSVFSSRRERSQEAKEFVAFVREEGAHFFNKKPGSQ